MSDQSTRENYINNLLTLGMEPFSTIRTQRTERDGPFFDKEHQKRNGTWMEKERSRKETF